MYRSCLWQEHVESIKHWNGKVAKVTTLWLLASALIVIIEIRGAACSRGWSQWLSLHFRKSDNTSGNLWHWFLPCPFLWYTYTYVYSAWSLTRVHVSSVIQLTQICIMYSIITVYVLPFWVASMPAIKYDFNGGLLTCLWYDSSYIRNIWLLVFLWNLCKPDMVLVSIYVISESEWSYCSLSLSHRYVLFDIVSKRRKNRW